MPAFVQCPATLCKCCVSVCGCVYGGLCVILNLCFGSDNSTTYTLASVSCCLYSISMPHCSADMLINHL